MYLGDGFGNELFLKDGILTAGRGGGGGCYYDWGRPSCKMSASVNCNILNPDLASWWSCPTDVVAVLARCCTREVGGTWGTPHLWFFLKYGRSPLRGPWPGGGLEVDGALETILVAECGLLWQNYGIRDRGGRMAFPGIPILLLLVLSGALYCCDDGLIVLIHLQNLS